MRESNATSYRFLVILAAVFLLPIVVMAARGAMQTTQNDVRDWLPASQEASVYHWFQQYFGSEEFVLISWEGCTLDDSRLELLADKLVPPQDFGAKQPKFFESIITGPRILEQLTQPPLELRREVAVSRLQGALIGPDGRQTCAVIKPTDFGKVRRHEMLEAIRHTAESECGIPRESLHLGGPPVMTASVDVEGRRSLNRLTLLSGAVGIAISWWCFRSLRLTAMVIVMGLYCAAVGLAAVYFGGSAMNAVLMTMPPLVYVSGASGAIHLVNYYRDTVLEKGLAGAPQRAVAHARLPLSLATGTTAAGLLSLCYSDLTPIKLFGVYSAIGIVLSFLILLFVLPSALSTWPMKVRAAIAQQHDISDEVGSAGRWWDIGRAISRRGLAVSLGVIAVLALGAFGLPRIRTTVKVDKFFERDSQVIRDYSWLEKHIGSLVPMELVLRVGENSKLSMVQRMQLLERIEKGVLRLPPVGSAYSAIMFGPELPSQAGWSRRSGVMNRRLLRFRDKFIESHYLAQAHDEELWRISLRVHALNDVDYGDFVQDIRGQIEPLLAAEHRRGHEGLSVAYTGMVPLVYKAQNSLVDGLTFGLVTDLALIVIVFVAAMRHWSVGVILLITGVFPTAVVLGGMGWLGIVVDVGTVMTPSVALGVTVDDVLHFLLWFRRGISAGMNRGQAVMLAYKGCARAMYQSWGVIGLGLAVFGLSPFVPTQRFGLLMVTLLTVSLIGNLVLLPALLAGPLGASFARRVKKRAQVIRPVREAAPATDVLPAAATVQAQPAHDAPALHQRRRSARKP